jgi:hypothetical protein
MLQEWWFDDSFAAIFDKATGHLLFHIITERRPGAIDGQIRDDGLCCLIPKSCKLEPVSWHQVSKAPTRISQSVHCRERGGAGRDVFLANSHLSFPGNADPFINHQRQANKAQIILVLCRPQQLQQLLKAQTAGNPCKSYAETSTPTLTAQQLYSANPTTASIAPQPRLNKCYPV